MLMISGWANAQLTGGIEQYYYLQEKTKVSMGPIAHVQTNNNWYAEARYNYEEQHTYSFYAGRTFSHEKKLTYSLTPMLGGVFGQFNGGSFALNSTLDFHGLFLTSQSQYTFSTQNKIENFYFNWAELGYQPLNWMYAGLSMQHTYLFYETKKNLIDIGMVIGFSFRQWTIPIYAFNPLKSNSFFVLGINWEWQKNK